MGQETYPAPTHKVKEAVMKLDHGHRRLSPTMSTERSGPGDLGLPDG